MALTSPFWALSLAAGSREVAGGLYSIGGMWAVGLAALATKIIYREPFRELHLACGPYKYLLWGFLLPVFYAAPVYMLAWITGLRDFPNLQQLEATLAGYGITEIRGVLPWALFASLGVVAGIAAALGEEIGWRGFLLPETMKRTTMPRAVLFVGLIWAAWHSPTILFADYGARTPLWLGLPCFTVMAVALTAQMAWLWLRSGSIWPAVMLHASHNFWIQGVFDPITPSTAGPQFLLGEFGIGVAMSSTATAILLHLLAHPSTSMNHKPA
jgi:membrane protease YdiL (CAAX protease family)